MSMYVTHSDRGTTSVENYGLILCDLNDAVAWYMQGFAGGPQYNASKGDWYEGALRLWGSHDTTDSTELGLACPVFDY